MLKIFKSFFRRSPETPLEKQPAPRAAQAPISSPAPQTLEPGDLIFLPATTVIEHLPATLRSQLKLSARRDTQIGIPKATVLEQLPQGRVTVLFSTLRQCAPQGILGESDALDHTPINLPLPEILSRLPAGTLERRTVRRVVHVPDDVLPLFGSQGEPIDPEEAQPAEPAAASSATTAVPERIQGPAPSDSIPFPAASTAASRESEPAVATVEAPANAVVLPLSRLSEKWPEPAKALTQKAADSNAIVSFPLDQLEPGMRQGKLVFTWRQLAAWIHPALPATDAPPDDTVLEVPLAAVAPLFLQKCKTRAQTVLGVDANIPNLFQPDEPRMEAPPGPSPAMPEPAPERAGQPVAISSETPPAIEPPAAARGEQGMPKEIARKAAELPGVTGVIVATLDGLLVAARVPDDVKAETAAAFLPQLYSKISQYAQNVQSTPPGNRVACTCGEATLTIFKCARAYLAVLGDATQSEKELRELAGALEAQTEI